MSSSRERFLETLLESATDYAIIALDLDGLVTSWNAGACNLLGWTEAEMIGQPAAVFFTMEDRQAGVALAEMQAALQKGRGNDERWHQRRDGSRFWASGEMMPLRDEAGQTQGFIKILRDRTAQQQAAERQRADTEFLRGVLAASGDCIKVLDLGGGLQFMNEGGQRLMEVSDFNAIRGCPWPSLWREQDQAMAAMAQARAGGIGRFQGKADTMAGTPKWWDVQVTPMLDADGRPERVLVVSRDITDVQLAEARLARSEERYRTVTEALPQLVWTCRPDGSCDFLNRQWVEYTGLAADQQLGLHWLDRVIHPDDRAATYEHWMGAVAGRNPYDIEYRLRGADGRYRWFKTRGTAIRDEAGAITQWFGTCTDIEDLVAAREVLTRSREELERAVDERTRELDRLWTLSEDLLAVADYDGRLLRVSPSWSRVLGFGEAALLARPYSELMHPDDAGWVLDALAAMRAGGRPVSIEFRMLSADGGWRWIAWTLSPEPAGGGMTGVGRDVTAERARSAELTVVQEALRQSQKMEAVGQLTGGLAHDFNNLLTGIMGSLELLQTRVAQKRTEGLRRYIDAAQGAARRAAALTHRLLTFSRRQPLDPKPTDLNRLVAGMDDLIRHTVGPTVALEANYADGLWTTLADVNQLENALLNLCINARDAMPDGGRLVIATANTVMDERLAQEHDLPAGDYLGLSVGDSGTGMAPDVLALACEPFFTTKPAGTGTGLGLSMVYGFARQSGGQIHIASDVGAGTTVSLYLPRHHGGEDTGGDKVPAADHVPAGGGETVLIVDDEAAVRMLVSEVLGDLGYDVIEAADGVMALPILRGDRRIDLLVTDLGLPGGMNGRQLADAARLLRTGLKVLFITGYAEHALVDLGQSDSGTQVLAKPFAIAALARRVGELIDRRQI